MVLVIQTQISRLFCVVYGVHDSGGIGDEGSSLLSVCNPCHKNNILFLCVGVCRKAYLNNKWLVLVLLQTTTLNSFGPLALRVCLDTSIVYNTGVSQSAF